MSWADYPDLAAREILTTAEPGVDAAVGHAALAVACAGAVEDSDRLVHRWEAATGRAAHALAGDALRARAWAMLFAARGGAPQWAAGLVPLDLDAEEAAHRTHLDRAEPALPAGALGDSTAAQVLTGLARRLEEPAAPDPLRVLAGEAERRAGSGDEAGATQALGDWIERAGRRPWPDVATLAGCRHVAPLLVGGVLPLPEGWARDCADTLVAALHTRYRPAPEARGWRGLVRLILRLRGEPETPPDPADWESLVEAERRLGVALPREYREFLLSCDGLPADVVFPRLLGAAELAATASGIRISEPAGLELDPSDGRVSEHDPLFGTTRHAGLRALLEEHVRLLEAAGQDS